MGNGLNTKITYEYRDGANYKKSTCHVVKGMCSIHQEEALKNACMVEDDRYFFVPEAVGFASLQPRNWDHRIDHPMCTITSIEMTGSPTEDARSIYDLIEEFKGRDWENEAVRITLEKIG